MARVSTNISRRKFPIGAPSVPISRGDISVLTAEQRAKSQFAEVAGIISASEGRRIMQADQKAQNIAGEAAMKAQMLALWDSFDTNPNEDEYEKAYEQTLKGLDKIIDDTTNANSKRDLEQFKQSNIPFWESSLRDVTLERKRTNAYVRRDQSIAEIKGMDLSDAAEYYEANNRIGEGGAMMRELGHSQEEIDSWMMANLEVIENQKAYNEIQNISNETQNILEEQGYEAAIKWLMNKKLSIEDRNRIASQLKSTDTLRKIFTEQNDDTIGGTFLKLLDNKLDPTKPQLTFDMINNSSMSFGAKEKWFTKLMTFDNYSEGELKEAFTDKGEVLAEIYDKIDAGTLTDELDTMVGKGLSPTTAERIKTEIRAPFEQRADRLFKNIFGWSPELGFENDLSSFLYLKTEREWRDEVKKQDATGEQILDIGKSIARPYFIEHLEKTLMGQEADIPRMVELALGEEAEVTEVEGKSKEDEGPRTYQDFEDEVARLKKIDMAKARAFYDAWIGKFAE